MNVIKTPNNDIDINKAIGTNKAGFKELVEGVQIFFNTYYNNDYDIDKTLKDEKNQDLTVKQALFFKDVSLMIESRFNEVLDILKELNINHLFVYSKESKKEMKNNPEKYDLILDSLISRLGVLHAYISINEYVNKDSWPLKYMSLICLQTYNKDDVFFLYGDLSREETKEKISNFLKE